MSNVNANNQKSNNNNLNDDNIIMYLQNLYKIDLVLDDFFKLFTMFGQLYTEYDEDRSNVNIYIKYVEVRETYKQIVNFMIPIMEHINSIYHQFIELKIEYENLRTHKFNITSRQERKIRNKYANLTNTDLNKNLEQFHKNTWNDNEILLHINQYIEKYDINSENIKTIVKYNLLNRYFKTMFTYMNQVTYRILYEHIHYPIEPEFKISQIELYKKFILPFITSGSKKLDYLSLTNNMKDIYLALINNLVSLVNKYYYSISIELDRKLIISPLYYNYLNDILYDNLKSTNDNYYELYEAYVKNLISYISFIKSPVLKTVVFDKDELNNYKIKINNEIKRFLILFYYKSNIYNRYDMKCVLFNKNIETELLKGGFDEFINILEFYLVQFQLLDSSLIEFWNSYYMLISNFRQIIIKDYLFVFDIYNAENSRNYQLKIEKRHQILSSIQVFIEYIKNFIYEQQNYEILDDYFNNDELIKSYMVQMLMNLRKIFVYFTKYGKGISFSSVPSLGNKKLENNILEEVTNLCIHIADKISKNILPQISNIFYLRYNDNRYYELFDKSNIKPQYINLILEQISKVIQACVDDEVSLPIQGASPFQLYYGFISLIKIFIYFYQLSTNENTKYLISENNEYVRKINDSINTLLHTYKIRESDNDDLNIHKIKSKVDYLVNFLNSPRLVYDTEYIVNNNNLVQLFNKSLIVNNSNSSNTMTNSDIEKLKILTRFKIYTILKKNVREKENLEKILKKKIPAGTSSEIRSRIQNLQNFYKKQIE